MPMKMKYIKDNLYDKEKSSLTKSKMHQEGLRGQLERNLQPWEQKRPTINNIKPQPCNKKGDLTVSVLGQRL